MDKRKINLEKVIDNLGENILPTIKYFMNGVIKDHDGSVDGSNNGLYKGLVHGEGLDELGIDKTVLESENPILKLCEIILEKGGVLFFSLGLLYYEGGSEIIIDEEYSIEMDEEFLFENYYTGGYGIFLSKDDWSHGYYSMSLSHCFLPPEEQYYYLNDDKEDLVAMKIIENIDEMDIYN